MKSPAIPSLKVESNLIEGKLWAPITAPPASIVDQQAKIASELKVAPAKALKWRTGHPLVVPGMK